MPNSSGRDRLLIIANPRTRGAHAPHWEKRVLPELANRYAVEVVRPGSAAEATRLARQAALDGFAVVAAAGGDGTVNAAAQGLCRSATALAILPLGSANDLARELGIPRHDIESAARIITKGTAYTVDLGAVDGRIFCGVGGLNLVARAALAVTRFKQRSPGARRLADALGGSVYRLAATALLLEARKLEEDLRVEYVDANSGERRQVAWHASAIFIANHHTLGGGLVLPVDGSASDGALELCVVPARGRISLMLNFARLSSGRRIPAGVLQVLHATEVIVDTSRDDAFVADGELLASGRQFRFQVLPDAIRILSGGRQTPERFGS